MSPALQAIVTTLSYVVIGGLAVVGAKYGVLDTQTSAVIIGGVLTHLGFVGAPGVASAVKNANASPDGGDSTSQSQSHG